MNGSKSKRKRGGAESGIRFSASSSLCHSLIPSCLICLVSTRRPCLPFFPLSAPLYNMLRRAPSWISLQEEELQWHLDRAFLQSLPDLSRLHLDDRDEYDDPVTDPSDDNNTSGESGQEHHSSSFHSLARASSSIKHSSVKTRASADANPTPNRVSNNAPASTSQVSSLLHHQACQPPERPFCDITPITLSRKIQDREIRHCRDQGLYDLKVIVRLVSGG